MQRCCLSEKRKLPYFPELDGVRGAAALAVFVHHFFQYASPTLFLSNAARYGYLGVQAFFVLSGFLITSLLFSDRENPDLLSNFYWKRVLRIWPVLIVHVLVLWLVVKRPFTDPYIVLSLLFVVNFSSRFGKPQAVGPAWTLAIEEQFYLIWPHVVRWCEVNSVFWISCFVAILSSAGRTLVPLLHHGAIDLQYTFYQCDGLALGAIIACQWFSRDGLSRRAAQVANQLNGRGLIVLAIILLTIIGLLPEGNLRIGLCMLATTLFTYRIVSLVVLKRSRSKMLSWLKSPPMLFMGSISYGFYMYQWFVIGWLKERLGLTHRLTISKTLAAFCCVLAANLLVSYLSLRLIEIPVRKLGKFRIRHAKRSVA